MRKFVKFSSLLIAALTVLAFVILTTCSKSNPTKPQAPDPPQPTPPVALVAARIVITPSSVSMSAIGETVRLTAQVFDQNSNVMSGAVVSWQSSDTAVATVNDQGLVSAASNGSAIVTAQSGNISTTAAVTVTQVPRNVRVEPDRTVLTSFGETLQINTTVLDRNNQPVTGITIIWESSSPEVATVSNSGLVTALSNGTATVTARAGDLIGSAVIYVVGPGSDRTILSMFYHALDGPSWSNRTNWLTAAPLVEWYGVSVDEEGRVMALNLASNGLNGAIPPETGLLAALEGLALDGNQLIGTIPNEIGMLSNLKHLYLSSNQLTGEIPPDLGNLENLLHMCLDRNRLSGAVSEDLGRLTNLKWLHLFENFNLSGPLPESIVSLDLSELLLQNTQVCVPATGQFKEWLEGIRNRQISACGEQPRKNVDRATLVAFYHATGGPSWENNTNWLSEKRLNHWHGVTTGENGRVVSLRFNRNNLSGSIPPELGMLTNLTSLDISRNNLSGTIPIELGQIYSLERLRLYRNNLLGSIPAELGQLQNLKDLDLDGNRLTGSIPTELGQLKNLERLELGSNSGQESNQLTGEIPVELGKLQKLTNLGLRNNQLTGEIPSELSQLLNLERLSLGGNSLSGEIPPELGQLTKLRTLWLLRNKLSGSIPAELGDLFNLEVMQLTDNKDLVGPLPATLTNLTKLRLLYISGTHLCVPTGEVFNSWVENIASTEIVHCEVEPRRDRDALLTIYDSTGGESWTDKTGWLSDKPIGQWHGVVTSDAGLVESIDLSSNNLSGRLPREIGELTDLRHLKLDDNPSLYGPIPIVLSKLNIESLTLHGTALCIPDDESFQTWLQRVLRNSVATCTVPATDREVLTAFYHITGGNNWTNNTNWLSDMPLNLWHGVTHRNERVTGLRLTDNNLSGVIPAELGLLLEITSIELGGNELKGSIPAELGKLQNLNYLNLIDNELTGSIPSQLGLLAKLDWLILLGNKISGEIPPELGHLVNLHTLGLSENQLTGPIPSELGRLRNLEALYLGSNRLTGPIPPELGRLRNLEALFLGDNRLTGSIPPELGQLRNLYSLELGSKHSLSHNGLSGPLPQSLTQLSNLGYFLAVTPGLCTPRNDEFQTWLSGIDYVELPILCPFTVDQSRSAAYLTQSVQSFKYPVPLVAYEPALLRVFLASTGTVANKPAVRATFYHDGAKVHSVVIPSGGVRLPDRLDESSLSISSNALIPSDIIRPGLSYLVELGDADDEFTGSSSMGRIPEIGVINVDVREMPVFDLTMVPLLWSENPDYSVVTETEGLTAESDLFRFTRDLLPVQEFQLSVREPLFVSVDPVFGSGVGAEVIAVRTLDGASGYYMGVLRGSGGTAFGASVSVSGLYDNTIAHELGHNLSLGHAPCDRGWGSIEGLDVSFPYEDGDIGAWGFDLQKNTLVYPSTPDLMSYCDPPWISDYHFNKMIEYRLTEEADLLQPTGSPLSRSLLLWGGLSEERGLYLEPSFAVDASASLPNEDGPFRVEGYDASGNTLFELNFAMDESADGEGSVFVFTVPVRQRWTSQLAYIALSGPEGYVEMTRDDDRSAAILLDTSTGRVRGILRNWPELSESVVSARRALPESNLDVVISRGIPDVDNW